MSNLSRLKRHLTYANVMATTAAFLALGGGAYAVTIAPRNSVRSSSIVNRQVKNPDIATGAASSSKLRSSAVTNSKIANGAVTQGKLADSYELGLGQTFTLSGEFTAGQDTGPADTADGPITFNCAATPTLTYDDIDDGGAFDTELWDNGAHTTITDGTVGVTIASFGTPTTHTVQLFGLGTTTIVASAYVNGTTCELAGSVETSF